MRVLNSCLFLAFAELAGGSNSDAYQHEQAGKRLVEVLEGIYGTSPIPFVPSVPSEFSQILKQMGSRLSSEWCTRVVSSIAGSIPMRTRGLRSGTDWEAVLASGETGEFLMDPVVLGAMGELTHDEKFVLMTVHDGNAACYSLVDPQ